MTDWQESTPPQSPQSHLLARAWLVALVGELARLDGQLGLLAGHLDDEGSRSDALAELRAGIQCVRSDLLADALETLRFLAASPKAAPEQVVPICPFVFGAHPRR